MIKSFLLLKLCYFLSLEAWMPRLPLSYNSIFLFEKITYLLVIRCYWIILINALQQIILRSTSWNCDMFIWIYSLKKYIYIYSMLQYTKCFIYQQLKQPSILSYHNLALLVKLNIIKTNHLCGLVVACSSHLKCGML